MFSFFNGFGVSYIKIGLFETQGNKDKVNFENGSLTLLYPCSSPYSCTSYFLVLSPGFYKFEVWGGDGGGSTLFGPGGYSSGEISLLHQTSVFIHIGGKGSLNISNKIQHGGYNGGGNGYYDNNNYYGGGGGGSSDIRLHRDSLNNRVIVAGGGGGYGKSTLDHHGGYGGGYYGGSGMFRHQDFNTYRCYMSGANQTHAGIRQWYNGSGSWSGLAAQFRTDGSFGYGGSFITTDNSGWASGGGGGGWYGGACGCVRGSSGSGGSGYVTSLDSNRPPHFQIGHEYDMVDPISYGGNEPYIPNPSWGESISREGHGAARITAINITLEFIDTFATTNYCPPFYFQNFPRFLVAIILQQLSFTNDII